MSARPTQTTASRRAPTQSAASVVAATMATSLQWTKEPAQVRNTKTCV